MSTSRDKFRSRRLAISIRAFFREAEQISQRETAPWSTEYGEPCGPVGRMQQRAGKRKRIQHLGPFVERVDLYRAEWNWAGTIVTR